MTMENCRKCKKIFPRINEPICDNCKKEEEDLFLKVKEYLSENRNATILEISENTGATAKKISGYLRDGRLEISSSNGELNCRICNAPINSGQYCDRCLIDVNKEIEKFGSKKVGDLAKGASMRTRK